MAQVFDEVYIEGLKRKKVFTETTCRIIKSHTSVFRVKHKEASLYRTSANKAVVPQGSVRGAILHLLYRCDIPVYEDVILAQFSYDEEMLAVDETIEEVIEKLQEAQKSGE